MTLSELTEKLLTLDGYVGNGCHFSAEISVEICTLTRYDKTGYPERECPFNGIEHLTNHINGLVELTDAEQNPTANWWLL